MMPTTAEPRSEPMDGRHEQLISNGERFKPAFSERDKNQILTDLRGISTNGLKTSYVPPQGSQATGTEDLLSAPERSNRSEDLT